MRLLVFLGLWLFAMACVAIGVWLTVRHRNFIASRKRVQGVTLDPIVQIHQFDEDEYYTRFQYIVQGATYIGKGEGTSNMRWFHRKGRKVWVYYDAENPENGKMVGWHKPLMGAIPILLAVYVVALLVFGKPSPSL